MEHVSKLLAAVSNPANQCLPGKPLAYCVRNAHWSIFEMVSACFEIEARRHIARQVLRHRSFSFQEFCVTGDTAITFESPSASAQGRRGCKKIAIDQLWDKWHNGAAPIPSRWGEEKIRLPLRDRIKSMLIRVFDEDSRTFVTSTITDVFRTGIKPVFEVELYNGKKIKCTKEHKFLTQDGFLPLEDAVGLEVRGNTAIMTRPDTAIACNGIVVYQDPQWLGGAKTASILNGTGLAGIADAAGCTIHTIRKWLKIHGLQFTKKEVAQYTTIWNKGASGYSLPKHRTETIEKMRAKARKGAESNLWRGGADRSERLRIADWCHANRSSFLRKADYKCNRCSSTERLELHHVLTVAERPDLAYEPNNIEVLCKACHVNHHNLSGDHKVWREKSRGNALTVRWSKTKYLKYVGEEMTYDLEVAHASHNYVGNGIVVHNSQRYASVDALPPAPLLDTLPQDRD